MRIEVAGTTARLYVNGAEQPCLIVNDLKQGDRAGRIALWAHVETDGLFRADHRHAQMNRLPTRPPPSANGRA